MAAAVLSSLIVEFQTSPRLWGAIMREGMTPTRLVREVVGEAHRLTGADPTRVAMFALEDSAPLEFPLQVVLRTQATLLAGLTGARGVSIWRVEQNRDVTLGASAGDIDPKTARKVVDHALESSDSESAVVVHAFGEPCAVVVWAPGYGARKTAGVLAERSARMLALAFERAQLLDGAVAQRSHLAHSAERRLSRIAFDLHDGPMQDLALLSGELKLLRDTLTTSADGKTIRRDPVALVDDALAITDATNIELRDLATSMESSAMIKKPFAEGLNDAARAFALRSGIEPEIVLDGDVSDLTPTGHMTLLRIIGEALNNAREHSDATAVKVAIKATGEMIEASIMDDGCGFDVQRTIPEATRRGSLGLVGMIERMRMIEGTCRVYSQPGVGTTVTVAFERMTTPDALPGPLALPAAGRRSRFRSRELRSA